MTDIVIKGGIMRALVILTYILAIIFMPTLNLIEDTTGVPKSIVYAALQQSGFFEVMLLGTFNEKHKWAHGQLTKYGQMPYDTDARLQSLGWSEKHIHEVGARWGVANEK